MPTRPKPPRRPRRRTPARARRDTYAHERTARQVVADWIAEHGNVCPGLGPDHPPHRSDDLTADHIRPLAKGGDNTRANYRVLCRSINSSRGAGRRPPRG